MHLLDRFAHLLRVVGHQSARVIMICPENIARGPIYFGVDRSHFEKYDRSGHSSAEWLQ
jgi:hypothetical protein